MQPITRKFLSEESPIHANKILSCNWGYNELFQTGKVSITKGQAAKLVKFIRRWGEKLSLNEISAVCYYWAKTSNDSSTRDLLRRYVTEQVYVLEWILNIGDYKEMIPKLDSEHAFKFGLQIRYKQLRLKKTKLIKLFPKDREKMVHLWEKITNPFDAYLWASLIGHREEMVKVARNTHWESKILDLLPPLPTLTKKGNADV